jgi:hypothetical protein
MPSTRNRVRQATSSSPPRSGRRLRPVGFGRRRPRQLCECRRDVDAENRADVSPRPADKGVVADDERDADALLVGIPLCTQSVLTPQVSVVGHEHDQRVGEVAALGERLEDRADRLVYRQEGPQLPDA